MHSLVLAALLVSPLQTQSDVDYHSQVVEDALEQVGFAFSVVAPPDVIFQDADDLRLRASNAMASASVFFHDASLLSKTYSSSTGDGFTVHEVLGELETSSLNMAASLLIEDWSSIEGQLGAFGEALEGALAGVSGSVNASFAADRVADMVWTARVGTFANDPNWHTNLAEVEQMAQGDLEALDEEFEAFLNSITPAQAIAMNLDLGELANESSIPNGISTPETEAWVAAMATDPSGWTREIVAAGFGVEMTDLGGELLATSALMGLTVGNTPEDMGEVPFDPKGGSKDPSEPEPKEPIATDFFDCPSNQCFFLNFLCGGGVSICEAGIGLDNQRPGGDKTLKKLMKLIDKLPMPASGGAWGKIFSVPSKSTRKGVTEAVTKINKLRLKSHPVPYFKLCYKVCKKVKCYWLLSKKYKKCVEVESDWIKIPHTACPLLNWPPLSDWDDSQIQDAIEEYSEGVRKDKEDELTHK